MLKVKDKRVLFVRYDDEIIKAFCANCSHQKTLLEYNPETKQLHCTKHGSNFDLEGQVLNGPAEAPVCSYDAIMKDGKIILTLDSDS